MFSLEGKKTLIIGVANENSIAYGCARSFAEQGADIALTYLNEKAKRFVQPLAEELGAELLIPLDVQCEDQFDTLSNELEKNWGQLDICLHAVAYCPLQDLHGRVMDCSRDGFSEAMDISVYSFIRMVQIAAPLMHSGGTCLTVSYYGGEKVIDHYNIMGPVKASLESVTRYLAAELGDKGITVHALSPGPMKTRAASGIDHFPELMEHATQRAPTHNLASLNDVGSYATFLASKEAQNLTGGIHYIDGGYHIMG